MKVDFASQVDFDSWMDLVQLVKASFPGLDLEDYKKTLAKKIYQREALVAREQRRSVGALLFSKDTKELEFLAVHPEYRKLGIARELLWSMFKLFPIGTQIFVVTYRQNDPIGQAARSLYEGIGFIPGKLVTVFDYPCQELTYEIVEKDL